MSSNRFAVLAVEDDAPPLDTRKLNSPEGKPLQSKNMSEEPKTRRRKSRKSRNSNRKSPTNLLEEAQKEKSREQARAAELYKREQYLVNQYKFTLLGYVLWFLTGNQKMYNKVVVSRTVSVIPGNLMYDCPKLGVRSGTTNLIGLRRQFAFLSRMNCSLALAVISRFVRSVIRPTLIKCAINT